MCAQLSYNTSELIQLNFTILRTKHSYFELNSNNNNSGNDN